MSPIEDYLEECLHLLYACWDRAIADCHRWAPIPGPRWGEAFRQCSQYGQDSDFLLRVLGAR